VWHILISSPLPFQVDPFVKYRYWLFAVLLALQSGVAASPGLPLACYPTRLHSATTVLVDVESRGWRSWIHVPTYVCAWAWSHNKIPYTVVDMASLPTLSKIMAPLLNVSGVTPRCGGQKFKGTPLKVARVPLLRR